MDINADLHCHSSASDGLLAPAALVALAAENAVEMLALTDHDETSGLAEAAAAAERHGIRFVPGVEISVTWSGHTIHIVGLGIDAAFEPLAAGLAGVRASRAGRAKRIAAELARVGIEGSLAGAARHAGNPALISRTHFARFLVERNYACDVRQVFHRFLGRGKPGFVEHEWARLEDALAWIHGSGGVAVVAHPGRYGLSEAELERLLRDFMDMGGEAIEVLTSSHTQDQCIRFARLASRLGLAASRGSDYHGPGESRARPGALPRLYPGLTPVWQLF